MNKVNKNPFERITQKGAAYALCMCLLLAGCFTSCAKSEDRSYQGLYYVVGYGGGTLEFWDGTAKEGGYLFISENLKDTLFASSSIILDDIFSFNEEIVSTSNCGPRFFSQEYRYAYKVQMTYKQITIKYAYWLCMEQGIFSSIRWNKIIEITLISK